MEEKLALMRKVELGQKLETIGRLAGGIAHDFNNILTPILLISEMMLMEKSEDSELQKNFTIIRSAVLRAKSLIKQIMHFSKGSKESVEPVKINEIINDVMDLLKAILPSKIDLQTEIRSKFEILASPVQIHQVLMNLCMNSMQAIGENRGKIKILLYDEGIESSEDPFVCIQISDTGCGISKDNIDKIFDPFYTTKAEGSGLGLALVKKMAGEMGGSVELKSIPDEGTEVTIILGDRKLEAPSEKNKNEIVVESD